MSSVLVTEPVDLAADLALGDRAAEVNVPGVEHHAETTAERDPQRPRVPTVRAHRDDRPDAPDDRIEGQVDEQVGVEVAPLLEALQRLLPAPLLTRRDDLV